MRYADEQQTREATIARLVGDFEASGLTRRAYSERAGIAVSTLDYYRRRLREIRDARIVPVRIEPEAEPTNGKRFQLKLANGMRIDSGWDFPGRDMVRLLELVRER